MNVLRSFVEHFGTGVAHLYLLGPAPDLLTLKFVNFQLLQGICTIAQLLVAEGGYSYGHEDSPWHW